MLRRWLKRAGVSVVVLLAIYAYFCIKFYGGAAVPSRNYAAEFSAKALAGPEEQRGVHHFREAVKQYRAETIQWKYWPDYWPEDAKWPEIKNYIAQSQGCIAAIRTCASANVLGLPISDGKDPTVVVGGVKYGTLPKAGSLNPPVFAMLPEHLPTMRMFTRLLMADLHIALDSRDAERALSDIEAMFGLARHADETQLLISRLNAVSIGVVAVSEVGVVLQKYPGLLNDAQLSRLAELVTSFGEILGLPVESVRAEYLDFLQRSHTDDGKGGGRFCMDGLRFLKSMSSPPQPIGIEDRIFAPLSLARLPGRKDLASAWNQLIDKLEDDEVDPWLLQASAFQQEAERLQGSSQLAERYRVFLVLVPAILKARDSVVRAQVLRSGAIAAIAIERWRLRHGSFPESLADLVPEFLSELPLDPLDGHPIKFLRSTTAATVYSAGSDGDDDGGRFLTGERENMQVACWVTQSGRGSVFDGDMKIWPAVSEPREPEPIGEGDASE